MIAGETSSSSRRRLEEATHPPAKAPGASHGGRVPAKANHRLGPLLPWSELPAQVALEKVLAPRRQRKLVRPPARPQERGAEDGRVDRERLGLVAAVEDDRGLAGAPTDRHEPGAKVERLFARGLPVLREHGGIAL